VKDANKSHQCLLSIDDGVACSVYLSIVQAPAAAAAAVRGDNSDEENDAILLLLFSWHSVHIRSLSAP